MQVGTELRQIRKHRRETLTEVSTSTGFSISYLSTLERNLSQPSLDALNKLADHYEVPLVQLIGSEQAQLAMAPQQQRPGFGEFIGQMGDRVDDSFQNLLIMVDRQARRPAETKDDWMRYYYSIMSAIS